ncbi:zinc finger protein 112-like [Actinia tenebrosa]|uniref:Zinc finger protein 112-like n=1 Tax=Actinia tenebrosa TaxID=6105 RepID=A0A6P8I0F4_ACTTE|nr:zinc finger protein 112-like [Actinia tenebrosa]
MNCSECNRSFSSRQRLQYHAERNVCQRPKATTICDICSRVFSSPQALKYHVDNAVCKRIRDDNTLCGNCGKHLSSTQSLDYHVRHRVCLKGICPRCDNDDDWHLHRCRPYYLVGIACEEHGDVASRCCPEETARRLTKQKKRVDELFMNFDQYEGVNWERQEHWETVCDDCGCQRSGQHIWECLYPKAEPVGTFEDYMMSFRRYVKQNKRDKQKSR